MEQAKEQAEGTRAVVASLILCHNALRSVQMAEFASELTQFCSEIIEVVNFDGLSAEQTLEKLDLIESKSKKMEGVDMAFKKTVLLVGTPGNFSKLAQRLGKAQKTKVYAAILDKVDLLQAMDFKEELLSIGETISKITAGKVIFTTNVRDEKDTPSDEQDDFREIKAAWMGSEKALIVRMNDAASEGPGRTAFESIAHLFAFTKTMLDKYILVFNLVKLAVLEGKTVIMVDDVTQAYRMKYFLAKFSLRSFVLSTDMPKAQISSILHFFNIGQFELLIMLQTGYSKRPLIKDITNIINFDMPKDYNTYKQSGQTITEETGCVLSLVMPDNEEDIATVALLQRKFRKNFGNSEMLKCLPVIWPEISKSKSRVESVIQHLSNKAVQQQKVLEFKKQLVSNRALKEYFKQNPDEKEILSNDIRKAHMRNDKYLFHSLDVMPSYVIPQEMLAITPEQIAMCGVGNAQPCLNSFGNTNALKLSQNLAKHGIRTTFAEPENAASIVQNMVGFPAAVQRYND